MATHNGSSITEACPSLESIDAALMEEIDALLLFTGVTDGLAKTMRVGHVVTADEDLTILALSNQVRVLRKRLVALSKFVGEDSFRYDVVPNEIERRRQGLEAEAQRRVS